MFWHLVLGSLVGSRASTMRECRRQYRVMKHVNVWDVRCMGHIVQA